MAASRYQNDQTWLEGNKGFSVEQAVIAAKALLQVMLDKRFTFLETATPSSIHCSLAAFSFTSEELAQVSGLEHSTVKGVLDAFSNAGAAPNMGFSSVSDYNVASSHPIHRIGKDTYALFQYMSLAEALYEAPFYWMFQDKTYRAQAQEHRGDFTEGFCTTKLKAVFGACNVHSNVRIRATARGDDLEEIDILVVFGDYAIIVQCKYPPG